MTTDERILVVLAVDREPWTIKSLAWKLGLPRREVEASVERLRLNGDPIIGDAKGLRLTSDPAQLAKYLEQRRRRLVTIYAGNRALRKTLRGMESAADRAAGLTLGLA